MKRLLFIFILAVSVASAATIQVSTVGTTETQVIVSYLATTSGACTIGATDNNGGPSVADLDTTKFGDNVTVFANQDLSRTVANGFRWPTLLSGLFRTVVIGTHNQLKKGTDGKSYSTALQTNTDHTITVSCNGGADTGTIHAQTHSVPYGSFYPEQMIPDATQIGFGMQPTINWTDNTVKYIDPITGVLIQRITSPTDSYNDTNPFPMPFTLGPVIDVNGAAWSNPSNFTTAQVSGTLATTTTPNAPIFAPFDPSFVAPVMWTDFDVILYGNASSTSVQAGTCISVTSGNACANPTTLNVTFGTSVAILPAVPTSWRSSPPVPGAYFSGWGGGLNTWFGGEDLSNRTFGAVSCSGTPTVCSLNGSNVAGFNVSRAAGNSFQISGAGCTTTVFTIATVDSWQQITTQQTAGGTWSNCTYRDLSVGIRVAMTTSGTLHVSLTGNGADVRAAGAGSNGARWVGGLSKVTDIAVDCNGVTQSPPLSGYLVGLYAQGVYLIQDNGVMCLQSNMYNHTSNIHVQFLPSGGVPFVNNRTFILYDYQVPAHLWRATHIANNYQAITPNFVSANTSDNFTWTDLGTTASNIGAQVIAAGGPMATALASGLFGPLGIDTVGDDGAGNGIIQYRMQLENDGPCGVVYADQNNNLISALTMWGIYPVGWGACHFAGEQSANYSLYSAQAESSQLSPIWWNTAVVAGGPFVSRSSEGMYKNGSLHTWSISISGCTKANPAVCTSTANNLDNVAGTNATAGAWLQVSGMIGTGWTGVNGPVFAHRIDNNTFSLYSDPVGASAINSTSFGTLGGTITATMLPALYSVPIGSVVNNGGNARMVANLTAGYTQYFPSGLVIEDGDPITITYPYLTSTTQYYAKVTGVPAGDFDVYTDAAVTTSPVPYSTLSGMAGYFATYAERCPDPATLSLPGPLYMDTGIGTTGSGNQKIRCVKIRLHDEGCSDFPATGEHATYKCGSDTANTARSSLHAINVGDAFTDLSHFGGNHEVLFVLAVTRVSTNQIDVTLERCYGDDPNYSWRCISNGPGDTYSQQHSPGWTLWASAPIPGGLIHTVSTPTFAIPPVNGSHSDFVPGVTPGNVSQISGYQSNIPNSSINVSIGVFTGPLGTGHSSFPQWSGGGSASLSSINQSYPSMRAVFGQAPASELNAGFSWNLDWMAMNTSFGNPQNNGDGVGLTRTLTNIRGGTYDAGSTTSIVYLIPTMQGAPSTVNIKIAPLEVTNWPSALFIDISGPSSLIADANQGSYCHVYFAAECRPNSVVGQVFVSMRSYSDPYGQCISNNNTVGYPCAFGLWPGAGWAVQIQNNPIDTQNLGARRLTLAWTMPLSHYSFSNWVSTPDGKWGIFSSNPLQQHPLKGSYSGSQWFAMKIPPTPPADTTIRSTFVPILISPGSCTAGDTLRVAFGYAENGDPANLWGTSRAEATYTTTAASATNPFVFASEAQGYVTCTVGVQIPLPAIAGRIVYYRFLRKSSAGRESAGALTMVAVP